MDYYVCALDLLDLVANDPKSCKKKIENYFKKELN